MAFAGVGVGFASECYSGDEFLLELSSTDREECLYACSVRQERCLLFHSSHSHATTLQPPSVWQVYFRSSCVGVVFNEFLEEDSDFRCWLHKRCVYLSADNNVNLIGLCETTAATYM